MFLKSLTLKGFKSFAEATTLEFEPGTTVVVGPNGSGKSNVVDAIGWVLGSQAPSAVRSQRMDDVIFAGTSSRPPLGRAEVSLTVDNSAGLLPIEFTEVTITRTLFRGGDSEYAVNGVPCRLLDVQELLSDTGVGRQQHVIVSQGQIDGVLNARPEDRRLIIEEAAGVLKYRRRLEKAERRLAATEGNLTRLQDLVREVRRQLRPLERQAEAARRHGDLVTELGALKTFLAGRDLAALRGRLEQRARLRAELDAAESDHKRSLAGLDAAVVAAEAELTSMGGDRAGEAAARFESLRERARGLAALVVERRRSNERERASFLDAAVVATLDAEADQLGRELAAADVEAAEIGREDESVGRRERRLETERLGLDVDAASIGTSPAGAVGEARGELLSRRAAIERSEAQLERDRNRLAALDGKRANLTAEADRLAAEQAAARTAAPALTEDHQAATAALAEAESQLASVDSVWRRAEAERHRWVARADALEQALDAARARAGAQRLAGLDGVVGTLLDLVEIDEGFEAAFEAAAGEALAAVVVESVDTGRRALAALRAGDVAGAVLPLDGSRRSPAPVPVGGQPLRRHVRSNRDTVDRLLDALIGPAVVVDGGWERAVEVVVADPAAIVVTFGGDRFAATGWRVGGTMVGATGAALSEARTEAARAVAAVDEAEAELTRARAGVVDCRSVAEEAAGRLGASDARLAAATAAVGRVTWQRDETAAEFDSHAALVAEVAERLERDHQRVAELQATMAALEAQEAEAVNRHRTVAAARDAWEATAAEVRAQRAGLAVRAAAVEERLRHGRRRLAEIDDRLSRLDFERAAASERRTALDHRAATLHRLAAAVDRQLLRIDSEVTALQERRRKHAAATDAVASRLDGLRRERTEEERDLEATRERTRRAELEETETRLRLEQAVELCRHELDVEPVRAESATCPPLPEGVSPAARVRELDRELRLMGPINPLAMEEHAALTERHEFLMAQLEDVKATRRELARVIRSVEEEIVNVFAAAYADVAENFSRLFETLFPGGRGRLALSDPEHLLDTGIEVEARPSGKNVKKLSLLSGGERSLTALAFLFAVFRSRPSPFYVLDEVEAALDDVNLHRFLDLVAEFRREAQLLIVSHQKRTMEAADCLYGVTMQTAGSSKVVSERASMHS